MSTVGKVCGLGYRYAWHISKYKNYNTTAAAREWMLAQSSSILAGCGPLTGVIHI